jgi:hypothetical protein
MSSAAAYRWGAMIARRRRLVLGVWALVLIACAAAYPAPLNNAQPAKSGSNA